MEPSLIPYFVIAVVAGSSLVVELLSWLIVYRTSRYKRIVTEITSINHKFTAINNGPQTDKDILKKKKKLVSALMHRLSKSNEGLTLLLHLHACDPPHTALANM